ncbi:stemmadenine O-acetyltransferase-like [Corylus avellana]|uniref:stemmadenine O-acetyltransferase-like n=1 Tax=Corylus avellana TaxID=13451 RepID=UPI001E213DC0|nr:stemmadenine O-acetyltransferase-like [Corylus avellana]
MAMNVEVVSREIVKPSSPTPHHLRNFKLSFLDQIAPPFYTSVIFFYDSKQDNLNGHDEFERSSSLKKSLAETLTSFYPLAGTLMYEDLSINCNDKGVDYIQARASCKLSEVVEKPNEKVLNPLLPFDPYSNFTELGKKVLLAIQYNIFECGGVAIGVIFSHRIVDGTSVVAIVNAWAGMSRGATEIINPSFDAAIHFPPREISGFMMGQSMLEEKIVARRFVFEKSSIDSLKKEASVAFGPGERGPSRVEAVSTFIWSRFMAIARANLAKKTKIFGVLYTVNLRERMVPKLPEHSIGNLWSVAMTASPAEAEKDYPSLLRQVRNAIMEVNDDYVKKLRDGRLDWMKNDHEKQSNGEIEFCNFTSWCRFPVYEADFGWGKPTWVCSPSRPSKNVVVMMSTKDGDGIETWVNMTEEDMAMFQHDLELLSFATSAAVE